jgi:hypothetical protein
MCLFLIHDLFPFRLVVATTPVPFCFRLSVKGTAVERSGVAATSETRVQEVSWLSSVTEDHSCLILNDAYRVSVFRLSPEDGKRTNS